MIEHWSIDQPRPRLRVVKLAESALTEEPVVIAEELSLALGDTLSDDDTETLVDLDFSQWNHVDSRLFALLLYFHRRCQKLGFAMTVSSAPRLLTEMARRLGVSSDLGFGVSRSRDYSQLFKTESRVS